MDQICMLGIVFHSSKKKWRINISGPWYYIGFFSPVCIYVLTIIVTKMILIFMFDLSGYVNVLM